MNAASPDDRRHIMSTVFVEHALTEQEPSRVAHYTPTRFVADGSFQMFPHVRGKALPRLAAHLDAHGITTTVTCLPHFLLLDPMIFWTHRAKRIPHAAVSANQPLAIATMIRELLPQRVIATTETARAVEAALKEAHVAADFAWYLFVRSTDPLFETARTTYRDLQAVPGLSAGHQCDALRNTIRYHLAPEWDWELEEGRAVGTRSDLPFPLCRFEAFAVSDTQSCACGHMSYAVS